MRALAFIAAGVLGYVVAAGVPDLGSGQTSAGTWFSLRGTAIRVVDGDTLHVRVGAKTEKVRLIGIDAPERGACYSNQSTLALRSLTLNVRVRLVGDRTQTRRDRYGRLLAYVAGRGGVDVGRQLLLRGHAELYETSPRFARYDAYSEAEQRAIGEAVGLHPLCRPAQTPTTTTGTTTTAPPTTSTTPPSTVPLPVVPPMPPPTGNCAASYPDVCIPPPPPDLDCGQISHRGFRVVYNVASPDPHRFDGDRDGVGCES